MMDTLPGLRSASVPSSWATCSVPDWTTPTCRAWQLSVPATGLMHSDHFQPGSNVKRAAVVPSPISTTFICVLSGVRCSSGESKSLDSTPAMCLSSCLGYEPAPIIDHGHPGLQEHERMPFIHTRYTARTRVTPAHLPSADGASQGQGRSRRGDDRGGPDP